MASPGLVAAAGSGVSIPDPPPGDPFTFGALGGSEGAYSGAQSFTINSTGAETVADASGVIWKIEHKFQVGGPVVFFTTPPTGPVRAVSPPITVVAGVSTTYLAVPLEVQFGDYLGMHYPGSVAQISGAAASGYNIGYVTAIAHTPPQAGDTITMAVNHSNAYTAWIAHGVIVEEEPPETYDFEFGDLGTSGFITAGASYTWTNGGPSALLTPTAGVIEAFTTRLGVAGNIALASWNPSTGLFRSVSETKAGLVGEVKYDLTTPIATGVGDMMVLWLESQTARVVVIPKTGGIIYYNSSGATKPVAGGPPTATGTTYEYAMCLKLHCNL